MAELAAGAVHSLLGVIRDETHLLGRVETDVQFIKEEMESMSSFLLHLSSTAPPGGADEHGEQVRTWMKQVRELAHDCNNSIDRYLQRGNPALYRASRGPLGLNYVFWWVPWYLKKLTAQHIAAIELRELKDRARDVGKRRLRYDVQIPKPAATATATNGGTPSSSQIILHDQEDEDEDDGPDIAGDRLARREEIFAEPCTKEECRVELVEWLRQTQVTDGEPWTIPNGSSNQEEGTSTVGGLRTITIAESNQEKGSTYGELKSITIAGQQGLRAIAIVAPKQEEGVDVASAAFFADEAKFDCKFTINVFTGPEMMPTGLPAGAFDILEPIMNQFAIEQVDEAEAQLEKETEIHEVNEVQQPKKTDIDQKIDKIKAKIKKHLHTTTTTTMSVNNVPLEPLDILLDGIQEQQWIQVVNIDKSDDQVKKQKIEEAARKIKEHMESSSLLVGLDHQEYVNILQNRLGRTDEEATDKSDDEISKNIKEIGLKIKSVEKATDKLDDEQIAKKIKETAEKIIMVNKLQELLLKLNDADKQEEEKKKKGTNKLHGERIEQIMNKTDAVMQDIKEKLQSKMAEKIQRYLANKRTLILLIGMDYSYKWDEIMKALSSLGCAPGSAVVVTTRYTHGSKEFCNPPRDPIICYLAGSYYKKVLEIMTKQPINYNTSIFRDILEKCEPHQFSMKIFTHAMFANPRRKKEELDKLLETLAPRGSLDNTNDKKMIKFSYNDLPKDFKTCLLYLAIFQPKDDKKPQVISQPKDDKKPQAISQPKDDKKPGAISQPKDDTKPGAIFQPKDDRKPEKEYDMINRSRLVGRWVVERLITKQDWSSSVHQAERCFDALVDRCLICPEDNIGVTGKVKICTVDATVHEFITKVARKRHIVEARLSHHLAKHFSVFSDVRLRSSDNMEKFFKKLDVSPQLPLVKVLDLQGCKGLHKNCLRHICSKMLLLKYLSLRNTGITEVPSQINNLHQLEVLDIRQEKNIMTASTRDVLLLKLKCLAGSQTPTDTENIATAYTTKDVLLLKLKRLLAGSPTPTNTEHARIPRGIGKMTSLEVLSTVKASLYRDFKNISRLWQLRKLGVVIDDDKTRHLTYLLDAIGDLSESLQSLSITLTHGKGGTQNNGDIAGNIGDNYSKNPPKLLESLSIDGYTYKGQLLPWLLKDNKLPALVKVTLHNTYLNKGNMEHLAELDNLCYLRLMCGAYTDSRLSFLCAKFKKLKYLLVECGKLDEISFDVGAAPELSKIVLSFTGMDDSISPSLSGINNLTKLKELEFNRDEIPSQVMQDIANHPNKKNLALKRIKARQGQEASASGVAP